MSMKIKTNVNTPRKRPPLIAAANAAVVAVAAVALSVAAASCSGTSSKSLIKKGLYNCSERLQAAVARMDKKNYTDAIRILDDVKFQCGGSPVMDSVYYYTAISHFRLKQYDDARAEFESLYAEFPRSPYVEEAHFRIAHMRYMKSLPYFRDQTDTKEAMRLFNDYADLYPRGAHVDSAKILYAQSLNKLAEKEFNNALFYRKQREHNAALIYYRAVISEYPESKFASEAVVGMAEMLVALQRTREAAEAVGELDAAAFDEKLRARIEAVRQQVGVPATVEKDNG
ncbi:MAG: outer membrane protein assembly factor BamD [Chitinispirillales bacterium]|nr:outer membrane protein assembly factor BamD [Chitinispirillales bacterium]